MSITTTAIFDDRQTVLQQWPCAGDGILTFSSDAKSVVTTETDGSAAIHDVQTAETTQRVKVTGRRLVRAVFNADSKMLILGDDVGDIHVANARTGLIEKSFYAHPGIIKDMALARTSDALVTACNSDTAMRVWDWKNSTLIRTIPVAEGVISLDISPDGRGLIAGGRDMAVRMWDMQTGRFIITIGHQSQRIEGVVFSADGSAIASCGPDHFLKVWETVRPSIANLDLRYSRVIESRNKLQTMNIEPERN